MRHHTTVEAIIDCLAKQDFELARPEVVQVLNDLCPLQSLYVAAKVARGLAVRNLRADRLAMSLFDDCGTFEMAMLELCKFHRTGTDANVVTKLADPNADKLFSAAIVSMAESFESGVASSVADHCQAIYDNADQIGGVV